MSSRAPRRQVQPVLDIDISSLSTTTSDVCQVRAYHFTFHQILTFPIRNSEDVSLI